MKGDLCVDFEGYRFREPFRCMCCGKPVDMKQFAFGRTCGPCDLGACDIHNRAFSLDAVHAHPEWWDADAEVMMRKYAEAMGAEAVNVKRP